MTVPRWAGLALGTAAFAAFRLTRLTLAGEE